MPRCGEVLEKKRWDSGKLEWLTEGWGDSDADCPKLYICGKALPDPEVLGFHKDCRSCRQGPRPQGNKREIVGISISRSINLFHLRCNDLAGTFTDMGPEPLLIFHQPSLHRICAVSTKAPSVGRPYRIV